MTQYAISFTIETPIEFEYASLAYSQIAAALRHHLKAAHIKVVGPIEVKRPHLRITQRSK
jgi:hypothetical protein